MGVGRSRREEAASLVADNMNISSANSCADWEQLDDSVIQYHDWWKERDKLETKYPPSVCREGEVILNEFRGWGITNFQYNNGN